MRQGMRQEAMEQDGHWNGQDRCCKQTRVRSLRCAAFAGVIAGLLMALGVAAEPVGGSAHAAEAETPWLALHNARTRLVASAWIDEAGQSRHLAGLEIEMAPGWKTYWRNPGDAGGVPPSIAFEKSHNVASATVELPAPKRFAEAYGSTIGYANRVLFPIRVEVADAERPSRLTLTAYLGICEEICVPVDFELSLGLDGRAGRATTHLPALTAALARVPRDESGPVELVEFASEAGDGGGAGKLTLVARYRSASDVASGDAFVETQSGIVLPAPAREPRPQQRSARFSFDVPKDLAEEMTRGPLTITLTSETGGSVWRRALAQP